MQAIETKFIPCTNFKPSRIKATCERGSLTMGYHSLEADSDEDMHREVANALCIKFAQEDAEKYGTKIANNPWMRPFVTGGLKNSYVHVFQA